MSELGAGPFPILPGLAVDRAGAERLVTTLEGWLDQKGSDATADLIRTLAHFYGMSGLLKVEEIEQAIQLGPIEFVHKKDTFDETVAEAAFRLVAFRETPDPESAQAYTRALCEGLEIKSQLTGFEGPSRWVHHAAAHIEHGALATRFAKALLQRNFLFSGGTLAGRAAALHLTPMLVHWWPALSMLAAGRKQPEEADLALTFNILEFEFDDELELKDEWLDPLGGALLAMCAIDLQIAVSRQA